MFVSVIIPTCDRVTQLCRCLIALDQQHAVSGLHFEIIISDDSNNSSSRQIIYQYYPFARWVKGPGYGPATNRNNGAIYANGDWFAFMDDDCIPDRDYLQKIEMSIRANPFTSVIEGYTYPDRKRERYDEEAVINLTGGNLWACNIIIRRNTFLALKGFCEEYRLPAMEDIDFHLTVKREHIPVHFAEEVRVCHPWRKRKPLSFKLSLIYSVKLLCSRHPSAKLDFNRKHYLHSLLTGIGRRTQLLLKFRLKGIKAYLEDPVILLYYVIMI